MSNTSQSGYGSFFPSPLLTVPSLTVESQAFGYNEINSISSIFSIKKNNLGFLFCFIDYAKSKFTNIIKIYKD